MWAYPKLHLSCTFFNHYKCTTHSPHLPHSPLHSHPLPSPPSQPPLWMLTGRATPALPPACLTSSFMSASLAQSSLSEFSRIMNSVHNNFRHSKRHHTLQVSLFSKKLCRNVNPQCVLGVCSTINVLWSGRCPDFQNPQMCDLGQQKLSRYWSILILDIPIPCMLYISWSFMSRFPTQNGVNVVKWDPSASLLASCSDGTAKVVQILIYPWSILGGYPNMSM